MDLSYSLDKVKKILEDFSTLTHFRIALFDENFTELLAYPSRLSGFCKLIRSDENLNKTCLFCDFNGFCRCKTHQEPIVYECHMGFTEIILPIISSDIVIAYLMCGQIKTPQSDTCLNAAIHDTDLLKSLNKKELMDAYRSHPLTPDNVTSSILSFLEILTTHLVSSHALIVNNNSLAYEIDQYILNHMTEPLDVTTLCNHFHYQKTNFYKITSSFYGTSIMKHIRHMRIQHAKDLLASTEYSISEVSEMVGIDDYNYFTKLFKKEANCTPREYRRNNPLLLTRNIIHNS